jgi:hypothetical protein
MVGGGRVQVTGPNGATILARRAAQWWLVGGAVLAGASFLRRQRYLASLPVEAVFYSDLVPRLLTNPAPAVFGGICTWVGVKPLHEDGRR